MSENIFGEIELSDDQFFQLIYQKDLNLNFIKVEKTSAEKFNHSKKINSDIFPKLSIFNEIDQTINDFDKDRQSQWLFKNVETIDLKKELLSKCNNEEEIDRVNQEWELFQKHKMIDLLHFLKYLILKMRENNIVWGVGRGSSVSSYILYLLGIHKINSIKYNLDITEFLK